MVELLAARRERLRYVASRVAIDLAYVHNVAFLAKLVFHAAAGLNAACFETMYAARLAAVEAGQPSPGAFKVIAGVSLVSWFLVIYWGADAALHRQRVLREVQ